MGLEKRSKELGEYFRSKLKAVNAPAVKDVRGRGLLIGVQIKPEYGNARPSNETGCQWDANEAGGADVACDLYDAACRGWISGGRLAHQGCT